MKVRDIVRELRDEGWSELPGRGKGSHRVFRHLATRLNITLPGRDGDDLATGTLASVRRKMRQAQEKAR